MTTRVGIPSVCESTASILMTAATAIASRSAARSASVSGRRGGRIAPPAKPTSSIAALKYWTSFGVMSKRASGSSRA